jgi:release factor glutamine methyltransferase
MEFRSAKVGEIQAVMKASLSEIYPPEETDAIVNSLFLHYQGLSRAGLIMEKDLQLSESELLRFQRAMKRLLTHEPLQYITGKAYFYGLEFKVDPSVLIPRPETEELIEWVVSTADKDAELKILDIGTGSGCIAISLKKSFKKSRVHAIDISEAALETAKENAEINDVSVNFLQSDILKESERASLPAFDIIVSNPPYVTTADRELMRRNVTEHEPHAALFVEDDRPLIFYEEIIGFAKTHLSDQGKLFFECNESNAKEVAAMMLKEGFRNVELRSDMQGKQRMVLGARF